MLRRHDIRGNMNTAIEGLDYSAATQSIIEDLMTSSKLLQDRKQDEAFKIFKSMRDTVEALSVTAKKYHMMASSEGDLLEKQLEDLEKQIGAIYQQEREIEGNIRIARENQAKYEEMEKVTISQAKGLENDLKRLGEDLNRLHERMNELKKWCWVPGYGQYLAVRTLVDGDIKRIDSERSEIDRLQLAIQSDEIIIRDLRKLLNELALSSNQLEHREQELKNMRDDLDKRKKTYANNITLLLNVDLFYGTLGQKIDTMESRIDDVKDIIESLDSKIVLPAIEEGKKEAIIDLKDAIIKFGKYLEEERPNTNKRLYSLSATEADGRKGTLETSFFLYVSRSLD